MRSTRGFVPRRGRPTRPVHLGWETSLSGWTGRVHAVVATSAAAVASPQRGALTRVARRVTKRAGHLRVATAAGPVVTGRPVGTRMGKGKGKPTGRRGWAPAGAVLFEFTGAAGGLAVLAKRSSTRVTTVARFY